MTIQTKATEQYFTVVMFIMLSKVVELLSLWMKSSSVTIQMKDTEQYVPLKSVAEILKCEYSKPGNVL